MHRVEPGNVTGQRKLRQFHLRNPLGSLAHALDHGVNPTAVDPTGVDPTGVDPAGVDPTGARRRTGNWTRTRIRARAWNWSQSGPLA